MSITSSIILRLRLVLVRVACNHGSRVCHLWYVQRDDCLHKAKLTDLETCPQPDCGYSMVIESDTEKVFDCHKCGSRTCRKCKADWAEHFGLRCAEVEQKSETAARRQIEETMYSADASMCHSGCHSWCRSVDLTHMWNHTVAMHRACGRGKHSLG
eukprot:m.528195 g.528195  ORF g.528195 m.528195 type:complete len:156 (-) comp22015_c0_seq22:367-834(-)